MTHKLLLLGDSNFTKELILNARKLGAYVIVSDNRSTQESLDKLLADEYWDVDINDLDELEKRCKSEGVTNVYAGVHETCLLRAMELSERLGLDYYTNKETWNLIGDKVLFKEQCRKYNVPVAEDYMLQDGMTEADVDALNMNYPVIVKPIDGSSGLGITICHNSAEVLEGYKNARLYSERIFAEKYIDGTMVSMYYCFDDEGRAHLFATYDDYKMTVFRIFSPYEEFIRKNVNPNVEKMLYELGIRRGFGFLQMMMDSDNNCAVLEMNYRLAGALVGEQINNLLCQMVLRDMFGMERLIPQLDLHMHAILLYAKAGTIAKIEGLDEIKAREDYLMEAPWRKVGDTIENNTGLRQVVTTLFFNNTTEERQKENIEFVYDTIKFVGTDGENILLNKLAM